MYGLSTGPCFANFYMAELETKLLNQNTASNPSMYKRYVDDIFCIFESSSDAMHFIDRLENDSVLHFTQDPMLGDTFNFLDLKLTLDDQRCIQTSVHVKPTDKGAYVNFHSHIPMQYKKSVINCLVSRAIKFSSSVDTLSLELNRIKQVLANNGYPQKMVDDVICRKMNAQIQATPGTDVDSISFYVQFYNLSNFTNDKKTLQNIMTSHVKPIMQDTAIRVVPYYKPRKVASLFSTRCRADDMERNNVVYLFSCSEAACSATYCGHTTQHLSNRVKQHRYQSSNICQHYSEAHNMASPPMYDELRQCFRIIFSHYDVNSIKLAEALYIRQFRPSINVKQNELYNVLKLF